MHVLNYYIQTDLQLQALFADFPRFTGRNSCAFSRAFLLYLFRAFARKTQKPMQTVTECIGCIILLNYYADV